MRSKRTKALDISAKVKKAVWARDGQKCIFCASPQAMPNAHVVSRAHGGLGCEENIVTACIRCHDLMDHTANREQYVKRAEEYLKEIYPGWSRENVIYKKYEGATIC